MTRVGRWLLTFLFRDSGRPLPDFERMDQRAMDTYLRAHGIDVHLRQIVARVDGVLTSDTDYGTIGQMAPPPSTSRRQPCPTPPSPIDPTSNPPSDP